jgi:hypothetical protein
LTPIPDLLHEFHINFHFGGAKKINPCLKIWNAEVKKEMFPHAQNSNHDPRKRQ